MKIVNIDTRKCYQILYFLLILYDNLHDLAYNKWQHGTCITQQSVKIQILHVPNRGALHVDILRAICNFCLRLNFLCGGDLTAEFRKK